MAYQKRRIKESILYPKYVDNFIKAFDKLYLKKINGGKEETVKRWRNGEEMFWWWLKGNAKKVNDNQISFFI